MKKRLRKAAALLMVLCLVTSACGMDIPTKPALTETQEAGRQTTEAYAGTEVPPGTEAPPETTAEAFLPAEAPLWDKTISGRAVPIPQEAFAGGAERCSAMAPDGVTLLMGGGTVPYLYNMESRQTLPLLPADKATEEYLRERLLIRNAAQIKADAEQTARIQARLTAMNGAELTGELCSDRGRAAALRPLAFLPGSRDNYLLMTDSYNTLPLLIDCSSGRYYADFEEIGSPCAVKNGKILSFRPPQSVLYITDLADWHTEERDFRDASLFPNGCRLKAADFLSDGSLCVILCDAKMDLEAGQESVLAVFKPGSSRPETYSLGKIRFNREPDQILAAGPDHIVVFNRSAALLSAPFLIDRAQGTVFRLTGGEGGRILGLSREEYQERYPEDAEPSARLLPVDSLADNETLLIQNLGEGGTLMLFRPSDGSSRALIPGLDSFPLVIFFSGNHYDRFLDGGYPADKVYYELTLR